MGDTILLVFVSPQSASYKEQRGRNLHGLDCEPPPFLAPSWSTSILSKSLAPASSSMLLHQVLLDAPQHPIRRLNMVYVSQGESAPGKTFRVRNMASQTRHDLAPSQPRSYKRMVIANQSHHCSMSRCQRGATPAILQTSPVEFSCNIVNDPCTGTSFSVKC